MFDLNTIINAALNAAVQQAIAPLVEQIHNLDAICQAQADRIAALETKLTEAALFAQTSNVTIPVDEAKMVEALNSQEWFWDKLQRRIDAGIEQSMDHHLECYDHDSYDEIASKVDGADFDDFVTNDNLEDAVREAIGNLSFDISVS